MSSNQKELPRRIDYLQYLYDDRKEQLDGFESKFIPSCLEWLRKRVGNTLSVKQEICLDKMITKYVLSDDIKTGYLYRGYADREDSEVLQKRVQTPPRVQDYLDDFDDDIPF